MIDQEYEKVKQEMDMGKYNKRIADLEKMRVETLKELEDMESPIKMIMPDHGPDQHR